MLSSQASFQTFPKSSKRFQSRRNASKTFQTFQHLPKPSKTIETLLELRSRSADLQFTSTRMGMKHSLHARTGRDAMWRTWNNEFARNRDSKSPFCIFIHADSNFDTGIFASADFRTEIKENDWPYSVAGNEVLLAQISWSIPNRYRWSLAKNIMIWSTKSRRETARKVFRSFEKIFSNFFGRQEGQHPTFLLRFLRNRENSNMKPRCSWVMGAPSTRHFMTRIRCILTKCQETNDLNRNRTPRSGVVTFNILAWLRSAHHLWKWKNLSESCQILSTLCKPTKHFITFQNLPKLSKTF